MAKKKKEVSDKERIKELQSENRLLREEIESLRSEVEKLSGKKIFGDSNDRSLQAFEKKAANVRLFSKKHYTTYLIALISNTSVFRLYKKIVSVLKKYTLITVSLRIAAYILTAIQSSAIFVVALSLFVVSLPVTFIFGYLALILSFFGRRRVIKRTKEMISDRAVTVFFAQRGDSLTKDSYFAGMIKDHTERTGCVSVIISPYFLSSKGISGSKKLFFIMREEEKDVIVIRRHFFFSLKKLLFKNMNDSLTMIY